MSLNLQTNVCLTPYNTFGVEAYAQYFATYPTVATLQQLLTSSIAQAHPILHIGSGSNLLFTNDFKGLILHSHIKTIETLHETKTEILLRVGSGVLWDDFVAHCVAKGYAGVENLSLIPGQVGAAAVQNIGAYGVEIKDTIQAVETVSVATGEETKINQQACQYSYRNSYFKQEGKGEYIITYVLFKLHKRPDYHLHYHQLKKQVLENGDINLQNIRKTIIDIRNAKLPDPHTLGNAGSFFMNPIIERERYEQLKKQHPTLPAYPTDTDKIKIPAGWLIEQAGLKGKKFGNVGIYEKQALVIVNLGNATGKEIQETAQYIQQTIVRKFGITLTPEVNYIG